MGLAWIFLQGSDFSIFGLRTLRHFGGARGEGQVGRLLGIFECFAEFVTAFIVGDVKFWGEAIVLDIEKKCLPTGCEF